jgi:hypothetical protein
VVLERPPQRLDKNIERIETRLPSKTSYKFAVIGNIRNSMRIFERRIAPLMGESGTEFMISVGNAVYDGAEGEYRLLYRGLKKLKIFAPEYPKPWSDPEDGSVV